MKGKKAPAYGIGTGPKCEEDLTSKRVVPGPGMYDQKLKMTQVGAKFGTDNRFRHAENANPGPGSYRLPTMVASVAAYNLKTH